jgi:hypothetical protein
MKLTKEQKEYIRYLREDGPITHSWRRIAELFVEKYNIDHKLHGNQLYGMDLCRAAECREFDYR